MALLAVLLLCHACNNAEPTNSESTDTPSTETSYDPALMSVDDFVGLHNQTMEAILLDVRTPQEFSQGSLEGAINMDYHAEGFEAKIDALNPKYAIFVYCQSGGRSGKTYKMLKEKGFDKVYNLDGGYLAWKASQPTEE